ncbi:zinc-ribbon domain-containing protein [Thauera sp. AutoDN2]|uniref:zinc-ribbon domain-containing protein n=1 Tax=Thauera sp. AutoDN2 TaxID=3416051 RepID=UPI003F4C6809
MSDYQRIAEERHGQCIHPALPKRQEKVCWRCARGHDFSMRVDNVQAGGWCPVCSRRRPWTIELLRDALVGTGIRCLSQETELRNNKVPLLWQCDYGHTWTTALVNVIYRESGCPYCLNKAEAWTREVFEDFFDAPFPKCRPKWLHGLELDGYSAACGRAFEYQGRQHYQPMPHMRVDEQRLAEMQARDARKATLCQENFVFLHPIRFHPSDCYRKDTLQGYVESELVAQLLIEQKQLADESHWLHDYWAALVTRPKDHTLKSATGHNFL